MPFSTLISTIVSDLHLLQCEIESMLCCLRQRYVFFEEAVKGAPLAVFSNIVKYKDGAPSLNRLMTSVGRWISFFVTIFLCPNLRCL